MVYMQITENKSQDQQNSVDFDAVCSIVRGGRGGQNVCGIIFRHVVVLESGVCVFLSSDLRL